VKPNINLLCYSKKVGLYFTQLNLLGFPHTMFILFAGIPTAIAGGVWLQYLFGYNFSVAVWVGFISIFGIVDDDSVTTCLANER